MSALAVSIAIVRGSLPSVSRAPRPAPRFRNRQASLERTAQVSRSHPEFHSQKTSSLWRPSHCALPCVAKNGGVVERAPAGTVCLVNICPVLEKELTGQERILHGGTKEG